MSKQTFYYVVSGVFLLVAVGHLLRAIYEWEAVIGGIIIPIWVSWAAILIAGYLGYRSYSYGKKL